MSIKRFLFGGPEYPINKHSGLYNESYARHRIRYPTPPTQRLNGWNYQDDRFELVKSNHVKDSSDTKTIQLNTEINSPHKLQKTNVLHQSYQKSDSETQSPGKKSNKTPQVEKPLVPTPTTSKLPTSQLNHNKVNTCENPNACDKSKTHSQSPTSNLGLSNRKLESDLHTVKHPSDGLHHRVIIKNMENKKCIQLIQDHRTGQPSSLEVVSSKGDADTNSTDHLNEVTTAKANIWWKLVKIFGCFDKKALVK